MKRILLLCLISSATYATELKVKRPTYQLEYDPKKQNIKILSKKDSTKECDEEVKKTSTKTMIEKNIKDKSKKTVVKFTCYL